jgi:hypothetical protein
VEELSKLPQDERNEYFKGSALRWRSPVAKLHLVDLVLRTDPLNRIAINIAGEVLRSLFDNDTGRPGFRLFKAVLRAVNDDFGYWSEIASWPSSVKLAMVWSHACKLFDIVHTIFGSPAGLTEWFLDSDAHFSPEVLSREPSYWNDCLHPRRLSRTQFLTHGVTKLLGKNKVEALAELGAQDLVSQQTFIDNENKFPKQELLNDPTLSINQVDSFLGGDRFEAIASLINEGNLEILASSNLKNMVQHSIETLKQDSSNPRDWALVRAITTDLPIYEDLRGDFRDLVTNLDFGELLQVDTIAAMNALIVISGQLSILSEVDHTRCEEWLIKMIEALNESRQEVSNRQEDVPSEDFGDQVVEFFETALTISVKPGDPRASSERFAALAHRMLNSLPDLSQYIDSAMLKLVRELPVNQLHGLWQVILAIRASRKNV